MQLTLGIALLGANLYLGIRQHRKLNMFAAGFMIIPVMEQIVRLFK